MPRKRRSPEQARREIMEAAKTVLITQGPDALKISNIAKQAGISHPLICLLYTSPSPRDLSTSRMPSSA